MVSRNGRDCQQADFGIASSSEPDELCGLPSVMPQRPHDREQRCLHFSLDDMRIDLGQRSHRFIGVGDVATRQGAGSVAEQPPCFVARRERRFKSMLSAWRRGPARVSLLSPLGLRGPALSVVRSHVTQRTPRVLHRDVNEPR